MHPLWLCLRLPSLSLEALPLPGGGPCAVYERSGQRKRLVCGNPAAETLGVARGQELGAAVALAPRLKVVERNLRAEREALRVLCAVAYGFSSQVTAQPGAPAPDAAGGPGKRSRTPALAQGASHAVWLEVGASLRLFGGLEALCGKLREALAPLGYRHEIGVAPTPEGASLLAGAAPALDRKALWQALAPLSVAHLPVDEDTRAALAGSGLRTFGEVLALPLDALARRFTPAFTDYLGRVTGRLPDARRLYRPPERYRRRFELLGEADTTEALRFPIRRMLAEFAAELTARDTGVAAFTLELQHEDCPPTRLDVALAGPSRDAVHLQVVAHTRLERLRVAAPVAGLVLSADAFAPVRVRQFDLFAPRGGEEDEWQAVLDRLRARLGAAAVQGLGLRADARPEKSWSRLPAGGDAPAPRKPRPLWLLPEPRALAAAPQCVRGPERIEGGWWDGADVQRDYYVAETGEGARLWVYREQLSGRWFLHGLWA